MQGAQDMAAVLQAVPVNTQVCPQLAAAEGSWVQAVHSFCEGHQLKAVLLHRMQG
jgi:hypothetical protein